MEDPTYMHIQMEDILKDPKRYANEFADGSEALRDLLLYCWENGINTYKSNAGELDEQEYNPPYIVFDIPCKDKTQILNIVNTAFRLKDTREQIDVSKLISTLNTDDVDQLKEFSKLINSNRGFDINLWIWLTKEFDSNNILIDIVSFSGDLVFEQLLNDLKNPSISAEDNKAIMAIVEEAINFNREPYELNWKISKHGQNIFYETWENGITFVDDEKHLKLSSQRKRYQTDDDVVSNLCKDDDTMSSIRI